MTCAVTNPERPGPKFSFWTAERVTAPLGEGIGYNGNRPGFLLSDL
jgi:hypothetical protein